VKHHRNQNSQFKAIKVRPHEPLLMTFLRGWDALAGVMLLLLLVAYFHMSIPYVWGVGFTIFFLTMIFFNLVGIYHSWRFSSLRFEISQILFGFFVLYSILILGMYLFGVSRQFPRQIVISWMVIWVLFMTIERIVLRIILRYYRKKGHNIRRAVIVGAGKIGQELAHIITENPWSGTHFMGFFDVKAEATVDGSPILGDVTALPEYASNKKIDIVYLALSLQEESKIQWLLDELADSTISVFFIPDLFMHNLILGGNLRYFENLPIVTLRDNPIQGVSALFKRVEDLAFAGLFLIAATPIFLAIAAAIKLTSHGPVLFKQWRYGFNGKPIMIYKFRTMDAEEDGLDFKQATRDDPRVTRFGAFLRRTSLDELPQLINVIQGRMSLVGPRPHPVAMNEQYRKLVPGYMLRHKVKPGMTGLAQVNGFRGETETLDKIEKRVEYDLEYLRQWSPLLDIKILAQTVLSSTWRTNAY